MASLVSRYAPARTQNQENRQHRLCPWQPLRPGQPHRRLCQSQRRRAKAAPGTPANRLWAYAGMNDIAMDPVVSEIAPGLNDKRPELLELLADPGVSTIIVEHRDRLARFGVGMVDAMLQARGGSLVVIDGHRQIGDVGRPDLVGPGDPGVPRQLGIDPLLRRRLAGAGTPVDGPQPHGSHQPLHPLPAYDHPLSLQRSPHAPRPVEGSLQVLPVMACIKARSSSEVPLDR